MGHGVEGGSGPRGLVSEGSGCQVVLLLLVEVEVGVGVSVGMSVGVHGGHSGLVVGQAGHLQTGQRLLVAGGDQAHTLRLLAVGVETLHGAGVGQVHWQVGQPG